MPGVRIRINTEDAQRAVKQLGADLLTLGMDTKLTEADVAKLEKRLETGLKSDTAKNAIDRMAKSLHMTKKEVEALYKEFGVLENKTSLLTKSLEAMGGKIGAAIGGAFAFGSIAAIGKEAYTISKDYESALVDMGRVTDRELSLISKDISTLGPQLGSGTELMTGYYQIMSAGINDSVEALDFLTTASQTAKSAHIDQASVVKALTALMFGYGGEIKSAAEASDLLFAIDKQGKTSVAELVPVIGELASTAHQAGITADEMGAAIAALSQTTGSTSEAATEFKSIVMGLIKPQEKMTELLASTGYASGEAMIKHLGFAGALKRVKEESEKMHIPLGKFFRSAEAVIGLGPMMMDNFQVFGSNLEAMANKTGMSSDAFERWMKTGEAASTIFKNTMHEVLKIAGDVLLPNVNQGFLSMSDWVENNRDEIEGFFERMAEKIDIVKGTVKELIDLSESLPDGAVGAMGIGLIGWMLFGPKGAIILTMLDLVNNKLADYNAGLGDYLNDTGIYSYKLDVYAKEIDKNKAKNQMPWTVNITTDPAQKNVVDLIGSLDALKKSYYQLPKGKFGGIFSEELKAYDKVKTIKRGPGPGTPEPDKERVSALKDALKEIQDAEIKSAVIVKGINQSKYEQDIIDLKSRIEQYEKIGVDQITLKKYETSQMAEIDAKVAEESAKQDRKNAEDNVKTYIKELEEKEKAIIKGQEKYKELIADESDFAVNENQRAINKIINDNEKKIKLLNELEKNKIITPEEAETGRQIVGANQSAALNSQYDKYLQDEADYYSRIEGMAQHAYDLKIELIQRELEERLRVVEATKQAEIAAAQAQVTAAEADRVAASDALSMANFALMEFESIKNAGGEIGDWQIEQAKTVASQMQKAYVASANKVQDAQENAAKVSEKSVKKAEIGKKAATIDANDKMIGAIDERTEQQLKGAKQVVSSFDQMLSAAMSCYDQESSEYKRLAEWKKGVQIAELAMEVYKNAVIVAGYYQRAVVAGTTATTENASNISRAITGAIASVTAQGSIPGAGFGLVAAMMAVMAGVLGIAGIAFSGSSSSGSSHTPKLGNTTVLGAAYGTESESVVKSYELMEDTYDMQYERLTKLYNELKSLNSNITGLVSSLFRQGGVEYGNLSLDDSYTTRAQIFTTANDYISSFFSGSGLADAIGIGEFDFLGGITKWVNSGIDKLYTSAFGGEVEKKLVGQGIALGKITIDSLTKGIEMEVQSYSLIKTKTDGGWFGKDKTSYSYKYGTVSDQITNLFTVVFGGLSNVLIEIGDKLNYDVELIKTYAFEASKIDLKGLTADEVNKKLTTFFSEQGDIAAEKFFGALLYQYQKVGEGLLETAIRIVNDKEIVSSLLSLTGATFENMIMNVEKTREVVTAEWNEWNAKYLAITGDTFIAALERLQLKSHEPAKYTTETYTEMASVTEKTIAFSEALISLAGDLETLIDEVSNYYDLFFSDEEKQARLATTLTAQMKSLNAAFELPSTRAGYRAMVEAIDLSTEAGMKQWYTMIQMADVASEYYDNLEDAMNDVIDKQQEYVDSLKDISQTIDDWLNDLKLSDLAPVTSATEWTRQYNETKNKAMSATATTEDVSAYLDMASQYLEYQKTYGTEQNYQAVYDAIVADVKIMEASKDATLTVAEQQLNYLKQIAENTNASTSDVNAAANIVILNQITAANAAAKAAADAANAAAKAAADAAKAAADAAAKAATDAAAQKALEEQTLLKMIVDWFNMPFAANGGLTSGLTVAGEIGPEWVVPTYEPEKSIFLQKYGKDLLSDIGIPMSGNGGLTSQVVVNRGFDSDEIGKSIAKYLNRNESNNDIHVSIQIDGTEIGNVVARQIPRNTDLQQSIRRVN